MHINIHIHIRIRMHSALASQDLTQESVVVTRLRPQHGTIRGESTGRGEGQQQGQRGTGS